MKKSTQKFHRERYRVTLHKEAAVVCPQAKPDFDSMNAGVVCKSI